MIRITSLSLPPFPFPPLLFSFFLFLSLSCSMSEDFIESGMADFGDGPEEIVYEDLDGEAIYDGDIYLGSPEFVREGGMLINSDPKAGNIQLGRKWPGGTIYYHIREKTFPGKVSITNIKAAIRAWNRKTNVQFIASTNSARHRVIIEYKKGQCNSSVGRVSKVNQKIRLSTYCGLSEIKHELGHTIGLRHEHNRSDRHQYIKIRIGEIISRQAHNFLKGGSAVGAYDTKSIMHYSSRVYAKKGKYTFVRNAIGCNIDKPPSRCLIGRNTRISAGDIVAVNRLVR